MQPVMWNHNSIIKWQLLAELKSRLQRTQNLTQAMMSAFEAHDEKEHVVSTLLKNGYSKRFIDESVSTRPQGL